MQGLGAEQLAVTVAQWQYPHGQALRNRAEGREGDLQLLGRQLAGRCLLVQREDQRMVEVGGDAQALGGLFVQQVAALAHPRQMHWLALASAR